jgi:hypothetical protein
VKTVIAGALGECVHVAGVLNFLRLAEAAGWRVVFLGPAVSVEEVMEAARRERADASTELGETLVGVSYRLTPETGERLLADFAEEADELRAAGVRFAFGGTPPVAERARAIGFFERVFDGSEPAEAVLAYLKGQSPTEPTEADFPQTTVERIAWKAPCPIIRHHFGLPTVEATREGIARIAEAQVLDVVSLGIDQDAQANFFHPERQDPRRTGAGGVPVRTPGDYRSTRPAGGATFRCCVPTPAPTTLSAWRRCTWRRSTSPGVPSPSFGSTRWMAAGRGVWRTRSASTSG